MTTQLGIKEKGRRLELFSLIYLNPALFWRVVYSKGLKKKTKNKQEQKAQQNDHSLGCVLGLGY